MRSVLASPALRAAVAFGFAGLGFAVGNLLLARALSPAQYALVALVVAFAHVCWTLGPLGADTLVNRHRVRARTGLIARVGATSTVIAIAFSGVAVLGYGIEPLLVVIMFAICAGGAVNRVAAAMYQSRQLFGPSLMLSQSSNIMLLLVGLAAVVLELESALAICAVLAAANILLPLVGWGSLYREPARQDAASDARLPWREGIAIVAQSGAMAVLVQAERFAIPVVLNAEALATFGVLAAIVGSPFRVLQMGVGFTMLPRLRATSTVSQRRRIVLAEAAICVAATAGSIALIWLVTPWLLSAVLESKYVLGDSLIWMAIFAGIAKVVSAFASAAVLALGTQRQLERQGVAAWIAVAVGAVGALVGAQWGLAGVVGGVACGWIVKGIAAAAVSWPYFSSRFEPVPEIADPVTAPAIKGNE